MYNMDRMRFIFGRSYLPISVGIQIRTWCWWSHVGIVSRCGQFIYEARGGFGVVKTDYAAFCARYRQTQERYVYTPNEAASWFIYEDRLGVEYDDTAFWGIAFGIPMDDYGADQCAEYAARGLFYFDKAQLSQLVPRDLWRISHAIK